ncbi:DUF222 domain-containing protein [Amycolatopsis anabasis]|uniref:HNH endonuclease n=1 Tax=Amycolatopsis anabasis TaxID=1840409 RepID=UPI003CCC9076
MFNPKDLSDSELLSRLAELRALRCQADAAKLQLLDEFRERRPSRRSAVQEAASSLRLSRDVAETQLAVACGMPARLPGLLAAMRAGELDWERARFAYNVLSGLSEEKSLEADRKLAGRIGEKTIANWRRAVTRVLNGVDPDGALERAREKRKGRKVELIHQIDSMASLWVYLPAEVAGAAYARVDALAHKLKTKGEERTLDQLRADVLAELLLGQHGGLAGVNAQVFVHIPIDTALGLREDGCELVGHGPIPGEIGREILNRPDSVWRKVLTDPITGTVKDVGRTRYKPPADLDELVRVRDRTCRAPGCNRPAQRCDNDHCQPWADHGDTCDCNLCALCRFHHVLKDEPGWRFSFDPDTAELAVTTPTGRQYSTLPEPLRDPEPTPARRTDDHPDQPPPFCPSLPRVLVADGGRLVASSRGTPPARPGLPKIARDLYYGSTVVKVPRSRSAGAKVPRYFCAAEASEAPGMRRPAYPNVQLTALNVQLAGPNV